MSKRLNKLRETMCEEKHKDTLKNVGLAKKVDPILIPRYLIPDVDPMQKQLNRISRLYSRRSWKKVC